MADLTLSQMLALLPDNTTGQIGADDLRAIVTALKEALEGTNPVNGLQFDLTPDIPAAHTVGHMHWNATEGVPEVMTGQSGVTLQIGQESYIQVKNTTGSTILNGRPVRITGGQGNLALVSLENGLGTIAGVMTHDLANNATGKCTTFGLVRDINTSAFNDGDQLWATSTGTLSTTLTSSRVGWVMNAHPTNGTIFVAPDRRTNNSGTTAQRPTTIITSFVYFDTTLGIPIFWNGTVWKNASGATV